jgi:hypothetical protein
MDFALSDPKKEGFGPDKAVECTRDRNLFLVKKIGQSSYVLSFNSRKSLGWPLLSIVMEQQRNYWNEIVKNSHSISEKLLDRFYCVLSWYNTKLLD